MKEAGGWHGASGGVENMGWRFEKKLSVTRAKHNEKCSKQHDEETVGGRGGVKLGRNL